MHNFYLLTYKMSISRYFVDISIS